MSSWREFAMTVACWAAVAVPAHAQATPSAYPGIGRTATPNELSAWDIDVRPDFKGLPKGAGTVARGMQIWEAQCASCHGVFGESNEFFAPMVGGTTQGDIRTGRVANLNDRSFPARTTLMKLSSLSTLWDYIRRAMPWNQPKSLSVDEVYAVTAYVLNLGEIVPGDFKLSDRNIAEVQQRLPNRHGLSTDHALWPGANAAKRKPDVLVGACLRDCGTAPVVASFLPDFARDAHGNLAEQNRAVGAQVGADTHKPMPLALAAVQAQVGRDSSATAAIALLGKHSCMACHGMENKIVGPGFRDIANKHAGRADGVGYLVGKIKAGGSGVWGQVPMPPQALLDADARLIAQWLADGAKP